MPDWSTYIASIEAGLSINSPSELSGLRAWYDASDIATITTATGVSQWNDKSTNTFNLVQADTSAQPALNIAAQNSRNTISFDGTDDRMAAGNFLDFERTDDLTLAIVFNIAVTSPSSQMTAFGKLNNVSPFNGWLFDISGSVGGDPNRFYMAGASTQLDARYTRANNTLFQRNIMTYNGSSDVSGVRAYVSGSAQTIVTGANALAQSTTNGFSFTVGSYNNTTAGLILGNIAEIIIYDRILDQKELTALNNYLFSKWAV